VCSKKKKSDKNAEKKQKKDLTGPTLLEISEYATYRDLMRGKHGGSRQFEVLLHISDYAIKSGAKQPTRSIFM